MGWGGAPSFRLLLCTLPCSVTALPPPPPATPTLSADRPMTDTMPEGCASAAACMLSPRSFTSRTPSSKLMAPAGRWRPWWRQHARLAALAGRRAPALAPAAAARGASLSHAPLLSFLMSHPHPPTCVGEGGVLSQGQARAHVCGGGRGLALLCLELLQGRQAGHIDGGLADCRQIQLLLGACGRCQNGCLSRACGHRRRRRCAALRCCALPPSTDHVAACTAQHAQPRAQPSAPSAHTASRS